MLPLPPRVSGGVYCIHGVLLVCLNLYTPCRLALIRVELADPGLANSLSPYLLISLSNCPLISLSPDLLIGLASGMPGSDHIVPRRMPHIGLKTDHRLVPSRKGLPATAHRMQALVRSSASHGAHHSPRADL